jgi:hypothetical protein
VDNRPGTSDALRIGMKHFKMMIELPSDFLELRTLRYNVMLSIQAFFLLV